MLIGHQLDTPQVMFEQFEVATNLLDWSKDSNICSTYQAEVTPKLCLACGDVSEFHVVFQASDQQPSFHNFILKNMLRLEEEQAEKFGGTPVFLCATCNTAISEAGDVHNKLIQLRQRFEFLQQFVEKRFHERLATLAPTTKDTTPDSGLILLHVPDLWSDGHQLLTENDLAMIEPLSYVFEQAPVDLTELSDQHLSDFNLDNLAIGASPQILHEVEEGIREVCLEIGEGATGATHDDVGKSRCTLCAKVCQSRALEKHMQRHEKYASTTCNICHQICISEPGLRSHRRSKHIVSSVEIISKLMLAGGKEWKCDKCDYVTDKKRQKIAHMARHKVYDHILTDEENKLMCKLCNVYVATKPEMYSHLMEKHEAVVGNNLKKCPICSKVFFSSAILQYHVRGVHEKRRRYHCAQCGAGYQHRSNYEDHLLQHESATSTESIICHFCQLDFQTRRGLSCHLAKHHADQSDEDGDGDDDEDESNEREGDNIGAKKKPTGKMVCKYCQLNVVNQRALHRHMQLDHAELYKHGCSQCDAKYTNATRLQFHVKVAHSKEKCSCIDCGHQFACQKYLNTHIRMGKCKGLLRLTANNA